MSTQIQPKPIQTITLGQTMTLAECKHGQTVQILDSDHFYHESFAKIAAIYDNGMIGLVVYNKIPTVSFELSPEQLRLVSGVKE